MDTLYLHVNDKYLRAKTFSDLLVYIYNIGARICWKV